MEDRGECVWTVDGDSYQRLQGELDWCSLNLYTSFACKCLCPFFFKTKSLITFAVFLKESETWGQLKQSWESIILSSGGLLAIGHHLPSPSLSFPHLDHGTIHLLSPDCCNGHKEPGTLRSSVTGSDAQYGWCNICWPHPSSQGCSRLSGLPVTSFPSSPFVCLEWFLGVS